jgi:two-component system chemotaxis sensor kinase CheA
MNPPLLEQFILEARDFLQSIGEKLIALEEAPDSVELMTELFRLVHTLKGNSGLFEFPQMTRVLHAGEDLMETVRDRRVLYSRELADRLLDAMDFVGLLLDGIEKTGRIDPGHAAPAEEVASALRALMPGAEDAKNAEHSQANAITPPEGIPLPALADVPEAARLAAFRAAVSGKPLFLMVYRPEEECFFKGEDPFHQARHVPGLVQGMVLARTPWPQLGELDCYRCLLDFLLLAAAPRGEIDEYFRYIPEQVRIEPINALALIIPQGHLNGGPVYDDFVAEALELLDQNNLAGLESATRALLNLFAPELWLSSALRWLLALIESAPAAREAMRRVIESLKTLTPPDLSDLARRETSPAAVPTEDAHPSKAALSDQDRARIAAILAAQGQILALPDGVDWLPGRLQACAATLSACLVDLGEGTEEVEEALAAALEARTAQPLREWLATFLEDFTPAATETETRHLAPRAEADLALSPLTRSTLKSKTFTHPTIPPALSFEGCDALAPMADEVEPKFGRRSEYTQIGKVLKVDQAKVDRLMNLIGEMVVAKNALPYLANRAENQYGVLALAREIKGQYEVIHRIAEDLQDAIMQVRMMPVSFIFQRFPRLVRDISRKLGKEVELVIEGEDTEADKNIIEGLSDPLIHIIRNSIDHGIELPNVRLAAGKPAAGRLVVRAAQESDRVIIEVNDDGQGIDPDIIKRKAYEKGVIDEAQLDRLSDQEALNLSFTAGFSTNDRVSDLSGRGVGMDVVRNAVDQVGGTVDLQSTVGKGTTLRLSLPLSMAVTKVMIIESDQQIFGVPMDLVVESVRVPLADIRTIKHRKTTVLRGRIVPLVALNDLLAIAAEPKANEEGKLAALVVRVGGQQVGLVIDNFREVVDVILKPLPGELAKLSCYAGTALLGDGSVLMVLNLKELF